MSCAISPAKWFSRDPDGIMMTSLLVVVASRREFDRGGATWKPTFPE
jgi:hypothetical protein